MKKFEDIEYTIVRNVKVPKQQIEEVEQLFGATLVPDKQANLIRALDTTLSIYRKEHNGKEPDMVALVDRPGELFKHMALNVNAFGITVPAYHKPAWFRFKKQWKVSNNRVQ